jgi:hypothetical protein
MGHDGHMTYRPIAAFLLLASCTGSAQDRAQLTLDALRDAIDPVRRYTDAGCAAGAALAGDAGESHAGRVATGTCDGTQAVLDDIAAMERAARALLEEGRVDESRALARRALELLSGLAR